MKPYYRAFLFLLLVVVSCKPERPRVLVFSKTKGYRHESIGVAKVALIELGKKNNFDVDTTEDASAFREDNLKRYSAVVFLSTTQDVLDPIQQADFKRYIEAGGGYAGIHAAADTEYEWPWYGKLVGAYFKSHPKIQEARLKREGTFGENTTPEVWTRTDEWYNYKNISDDIKVIYTLDESSYEGGENGDRHPIAWYHNYAGGRAFYTGLGHTNESYSDPVFLNHILDGIRYAIGDARLDYTKATTKRVPEENRFTKTVLDFNLDEPTELTVLPDGRVIFVERKGNVKLYDPATGKVNVINTFNVWTKFEDGIIGLTSDPDFAQNHYVYVFYSHPEKSANVVSRFTFAGDHIDMASEKVIIEVPTQRETCCHTGGSLLFGAGRDLYISTGDNTSPFESDGYSPSDERAGRSPFDAQKSSANTNDLRGKILRIRVAPDGTYSIPEGNLFPVGEPKTRPEIYVMGNRNPYRISIDERTGFLYWGEVGPDAGGDDSLRGPRGYDELNQARKAGFFGWPYFVGKNYPYARYDFAARQARERWDPEHPKNLSPNNTGKQDLPPVSPPFIWYPYAKSEEFPMVKEGGRNAMAGPVYYSKKYTGQATAFPDYFDGKLLIYDWMRNWMFLVSMNEAGDIADIEPFMPNTKFNNIIDMAYGPDGRLYMIEYGTAWFKQNMDARLVRIDYNGGNRPPVAALSADQLSGKVPLTVKFSSAGSQDYDGDAITYSLAVAGQELTSPDGNFTVNLDKPGVYDAVLTIKDAAGLTAESKVSIIAGNEAPQVSIDITTGNKTFFFPNTPVTYNVSVTDHEDGSTRDQKIAPGAVTVSFDYVKGFDMTGVAQGHQKPTAELPGKALMASSDCKACHLADQKSAGPSYQDIAKKYRADAGAIDKLAAKIIKGGAGVWGTTEMAAHPQISVEDARKIVEYIMTFGQEKASATLPLSGTVKPGAETDGVYLLTATYHDKGAGQVPSLTGAQTYLLRSGLLKPDQAEVLQTARVMRQDNQVALENVRHNAHAGYKHIDLTGVTRAALIAYVLPGQTPGGDIEIHQDAPDGPLLGKVTATAPGLSTLPVNVKPGAGYHDLYVVFKNPDAGDKSLLYFGGIQLFNH